MLSVFVLGEFIVYLLLLSFYMTANILRSYCVMGMSSSSIYRHSGREEYWRLIWGIVALPVHKLDNVAVVIVSVW